MMGYVDVLWGKEEVFFCSISTHGQGQVPDQQGRGQRALWRCREPVPCPGRGAGWAPLAAARRQFFLPYIQVQPRRRSNVFLRFNQITAHKRHGAEQNPSWQETLLWPTWACRQLYLTCGSVVPKHPPIRQTWPRRGGSAKKTLSPGSTYPQHAAISSFSLFFFFSCVCLSLHRIFTLRTGSACPSWQPAAFPGKREYRPGASFQRGGFSSPKYLGVVEREDFCQATSFLLRQVTAACDGLS